MLRKGLNGNQLKLIAVAVMLIDHAGLIIAQRIFPQLYLGTDRYLFWNTIYILMRSIGRIAFPIFCFLIAEGFFHTRDWKKYAARLGIFALISELPFDYMVYGKWLDFQGQNVFWTLFLGVLMMAVIREIAARATGPEGPAIQVMSIAAFCVIAKLIRCDYDYTGIMLIAVFYWFRSERVLQCLTGYICMLWSATIWQFRIALLIPFALLYFYNGERGSEWRGARWFFYWFYPVHMVVITFAGNMILR